MTRLQTTFCHLPGEEDESVVHEHRQGSVPMSHDVAATDPLGTGQDALLIRWWHALPRYERLRVIAAGERVCDGPRPEVRRARAGLRVESPVLLIQSITACVLANACLVLGIGGGFAGASLVVCVVVMVVGVVTFAEWLRSGRARGDGRSAVTRLSAAGIDVALVTSSISR